MTQREIYKTLEQFAQQRHITFYSSSEKKFNIPNRARRYIASRYVIYDLCKIAEGLYFIFYDSSTGGTYNSGPWGVTYCGLFKEIKDFDYNVIIKERQWPDTLSMSKRIKTGNKLLDESISILSDSRKIDHNFHSEKKVHELHRLMHQLNPLKVETEVEAWNIVPDLDHKTLISVTLNYWLFDHSKLKEFIEKSCRYLLEN